MWTPSARVLRARCGLRRARSELLCAEWRALHGPWPTCGGRVGAGNARWRTCGAWLSVLPLASRDVAGRWGGRERNARHTRDAICLRCMLLAGPRPVCRRHRRKKMRRVYRKSADELNYLFVGCAHRRPMLGRSRFTRRDLATTPNCEHRTTGRYDRAARVPSPSASRAPRLRRARRSVRSTSLTRHLPRRRPASRTPLLLPSRLNADLRTSSAPASRLVRGFAHGSPTVGSRRRRPRWTNASCRRRPLSTVSKCQL